MAVALVLYVPSGASYFSLAYAGRDRSIGGADFAGRIIEIATIGQRADWRRFALQQASIEVTLTNNSRGDEWTTFISELAGVEASRIRADVRLYFPSLRSLSPSNYINIFRGYVDQIVRYTPEMCQLSICDGLAHLRNLLGIRIPENLTGDIPVRPEAIGKMAPIIYGTIRNCPTICVASAATAVLSEDIGPDDLVIPFLIQKLYEDKWDAPGCLFIGDELIRYPEYIAPGSSTKNPEYIVNSNAIAVTEGRFHLRTPSCRGYMHTPASPHYKGAILLHWAVPATSEYPSPSPVEHQYLVAGHEVALIENIRVNGQTPDDDDYEARPDYSGWSQLRPAAAVLFDRNPLYPDEQGSATTKRVYFTEHVSGGSDVENIIETRPADAGPTNDWGGPGGEGRDCALVVNEHLKVKITGKEWSLAGSSLGKIKSAKLVIKSAINIPDHDDGFDCTIDPTRATAWVYLKKASGGHLIGGTRLGTCQKTGDLITERVYPSSFSGRYSEDSFHSLSRPDSVPFWFSPERVTQAEQQSWPPPYTPPEELPIEALGYYTSAFMLMPFDMEADKNCGQFRFPSWRNLCTTSVLFRCAYRIYANSMVSPPWTPPAVRLAIQTDTGELVLTGVPLSIPGTGPRYGYVEYSPTAAQDAMVLSAAADRIKSVDLRFSGGSGSGSRLAIYFTRFYVDYSYYPTDYGDTKVQEYDLDLDDWADLDGMEFELCHGDPQTRSDGSRATELKVYDAHIEIEYWPYPLGSEPSVTCDVQGQCDVAAVPALGTQKDEYAEDIIYHILSKWGRDVCPPLVPPETSYYYIDDFISSGKSNRTFGLRIDTRENLVELINRISEKTCKQVYFRALRFYCRTRVAPASWGASVWDIDESHILRDSFEVRPEGIGSIVNSIEYLTRPDYSTGQWGTSETAEDATSISRYGTRSEEMQLDTLTDSDDSTVPDFYLALLKDKRTVYSFRVRPEGTKLDLGDIITVTYSLLGISAVKCQVIGTEFNWPDWENGVPPSVSLLVLAQT